MCHRRLGLHLTLRAFLSISQELTFHSLSPPAHAKSREGRLWRVLTCRPDASDNHIPLFEIPRYQFDKGFITNPSLH